MSQKIEGVRKLGPRRGKRIRCMNRELAKIDETIKESEKVLETTISIVSQPSECLKFMTFREGCFVIRN